MKKDCQLMLMVGPSKCDDERDARTKLLEEIWNRLMHNPHYNEGFNLLSTAIDLYREGLSCFQNGAYLATAILCRATVEACVHLVLSRKQRIETGYRIQTVYSRHSWGALKDHALEDPILKDKIREIENIRQEGNFAVHLSQRIDKQIIVNMKKTSRNTRSFRPMKLWTTACEAKDSLEKTCNILGYVIEKVSTSGKSTL